ncbi:hypothetical protein QA600_05415 [Natronococcus sp. A-GB1]|uniref:DUF7093 family protein n=1 Tax=Natronococcus sp. A-GB1 TaxID=3037648 RepID=UPI00241F9277|nr:hypothetical protein [Natronococcus sp. A-GB1]MDG5758775.1 hypothetical protein [Natronococcus sp. A-GB1]
MVLRCSLLGHDYGDVDVEREREERGSEVVVTVREYEECARCGDKHVVSENTEVRSISMADAGPRPDEPEPQSTPRSAEPPAAEPGADTGGFTAESGATDATFIDADDAGSEPPPPQPSSPDGTEKGTPETEPPEGDAAESDFAETDATSFGSTGPSATGTDAADTGVELPTDENGDPVTDDGEILEDDGTTTRDREYGEWPDSSDVGPPVEHGSDDDPEDWPDRESEPLEDDAILLDTGAEMIEANSSDGETEPETEPEPSGSGSSPAGGPPASRSGEATVDAEASAEPGSGIERASEAPTPGSEGGIPGGDGQAKLHCPRCGFTAGSERSSLRTGDICPDCQMGYLGAQPDR